MHYSVSYDRKDETPEAKARWFQSLSIEERMDYLCFITDLALSRHPDMMERKDATPIEGRVQVVGRLSAGKAHK